MPRIIKIVVLALALLASHAAAVSAQAAAPLPFTITDQPNFETGLNTFTATGPLCPSGTYVDAINVNAEHHETLNLLIRSVYTCDDGSGTFYGLKQLSVTFTGDEPPSATVSGTIQLRGGTGAYTDLVGHGVVNGVITGETGVGHTSGFITQR